MQEQDMDVCPIVQFQHWFSEASVLEVSDSTAMVLSTVDATGHPDARVVLLKEIKDGTFIFYSNYHSKKGQDMDQHPWVSLTFYWPIQSRQVRIKGSVTQISAIDSDRYFSSRPFKSQISAFISAQSQAVESRSALEQLWTEALATYPEGTLPRPKHWGGYSVLPSSIEFWQGRDDRLHDRIQYQKTGTTWIRQRLCP